MSRVVALASILVLAAACAEPPEPPPAPKVKSALPGLPPGYRPPSSLDDYARPPGAPSRLLDLNGDPKAAPPKTGHKGSAYDTHIPTAQRTSLGYEISFGTNSPVTTPTVHGSTLLVSGGFNSHEIYAVDAKTGHGIWGKRLSDDGPSAVACEGELCAFNSESCTTFAVNVKTGNVLWSWWLGDPQTSAPAVADGRVFTSYPAPYYYQSFDGTAAANPGARPAGATHVLAAFDLETGGVLWQRWLDADVMSAPVAQDGFVYVTTFAGSVMKLEQATGVIRYAVDMRATSAPVVLRDETSEALVITARVEERALAREAIVRSELGMRHPDWYANRKIAPYLDGVVQGQTQAYLDGLQYDSGNGFGSTPTAANAGVAKQTVGVASVATMQRFQGSRVLVAGDQIFSTMGDEVVAVDAETGKVNWRHALTGDTRADGGHLGTAPIRVSGEVIVATLGGEVTRLDEKTGRVVALYKTGAPLRSQPVAMNGWIYAGTEDGRLIAIDTNDPAVTGWPTWGGDPGRTSVRL
jgi:outer membrane protein assembly factor BamB